MISPGANRWRGATFQEKLDEHGPFEWRRATQIIRQVADGLLYAHQRGVIHRDLKPQNIMIDSDGSARLADLGLAKIATPGQASATLGRDVLGTPYYMSPEQVKKPGEVDFRSDIYSLGATLYHMTTGLPPFEAPTPFEIMAKHLYAPLSSPRERKSDLPEGLCAVVMRAMAKQPQDRHQSYEELIGDLDKLLSGEPLAEVPVAPAEEGVAEKAVAEVREEGEKPPSRPRPIQPQRFPVTVQNLQAKMTGLLAFLAYAFFLVSLYHVLVSQVGLIPALTGPAAVLALSAGWSLLVFRRGSRGADEEGSKGLEEKLKPALDCLCERLALPKPHVHISRRLDNACFAYSFSSRKASVDIPGAWIKGADLSEQETEAFLAQGLGGIYSGDSDIRMLLALPVELLKIGRWLVRRVFSLFPSFSARLRLWFVQGFTVAGMVVAFALIALLFRTSFWGGIVGLLFVGLLLLVAGFERSCRYVEDAFAAKVLESEEIVKSLVAASGLASEESYRLRRELAGATGTQSRRGGPGQGEARSLVESLVRHYSKARYSPGPLERVRTLFSPAPSAAQRLNQLAGVAESPLPIAAAISSARRLYVSVSGREEKGTMYVRELAATGFYKAAGTIAGIVSIAMVALLLPWGIAHYAGFLGVMALMGTASGFLLAVLLLPEGLSAGRFGWAVVVTSVFFTCTNMLGLCLSGGRILSQLALHFPVSLVLISLFAFFIGALFVRLYATLRTKMQRATHEAGPDAAELTNKPADEKDSPQGRQASEGPSDPGSAQNAPEEAQREE